MPLLVSFHNYYRLFAECMTCNQRFRGYRITHLTQYRRFFVDIESENAFVVALAAFWCFIVMSVFDLEKPRFNFVQRVPFSMIMALIHVCLFYAIRTSYNEWHELQHHRIEIRQWNGTDRTFILNLTASQQLREFSHIEMENWEKQNLELQEDLKWVHEQRMQLYQQEPQHQLMQLEE